MFDHTHGKEPQRSLVIAGVIILHTHGWTWPMGWMLSLWRLVPAYGVT